MVKQAITIDKIILREVEVPMRFAFETSFTSLPNKNAIIVELHSGDKVGYGECAALKHPFYSEESVIGAYPVLEEIFAPQVIEKGIFKHPDEVDELFSWVRGNRFARSAINCAFWDLYSQELGTPLYKALNGEYETVESGVSIGIQESIDKLLHVVDASLKKGYRRIKMKIKPGKDYEYVQAVVENYPTVPLTVDANSCYTLADIELFKKLDQLNLTMIEQPLAHDDIIDHATLQKQIQTPICLDESIHSAEDVRKAGEIGACKIINIKVARVGGLSEAIKVHDMAQKYQMPVWCGSMLELGVGQLASIAIASLPNFTLAHDIVPSSHYFHEDIIKPPIVMEDGFVKQSQESGLGANVNKELLEQLTVRKTVVQ
ncbi:MAG TPA: o-succinylbenzoate synthase [Enterococcus sp.]|nr:o-succinylbenzoate synthase [Enterococcus sp.]HPR80730.1 o-succinylbenzoate synthase [Enterococcus sp.]